MRPVEQFETSPPHDFPAMLSNDAFVMADPAVEVLEREIDEHRLLSHGHFEVGMVVPPGEGLLEFVAALMGRPVRLGTLRAQFDDQSIIDKMLASLYQHGFVHLTSQTKPSPEELAHFRTIAEQTRRQLLRRAVVIDLDHTTSVEDILLDVGVEQNAPEVLLRCARLADHTGTLRQLARLRKAGKVRMHHTVVQTRELSGDEELCRSLIRLGAAVYLEDVPWPASGKPIPGLNEMTRNRVAVHALTTPGLSILDDGVRRRALAWAGSVFISGFCLRIDAEALWPAGDAKEADFVAVFEAVRAIENEFGDVLIVDLPSDEVLLGNTESSPQPEPLSNVASRFRAAYLRWRLPLLKSCENDNSWSQTPEVEDKLVRAQEDLLPTHPELLLLRPGSVVVDVGGGLGRVARRLAPAVGEDGLVISIEMFRCLSDRARRFACGRNITNVDFRPGLAQRIPLPDATADAAINEWTGGIWELGLGPAMIGEMARVVRRGGRVAATHRLVRLHCGSLGHPWVQYEEIYKWMRESFEHPGLTVIAERVWGQIVPSLIGENATLWRRQYMPRLINPYDLTYKYDDSADTRADVFLTIIAQRE